MKQIATGDFDGDSTPDLAAVDDTGDIYLLLNDDSSTPGTLSEQDLVDDFDDGPDAFAAGDFDADGTSELIGIFQFDEVVQVRGSAIAPFQEDVGNVFDIVVADFDGDFHDDVALGVEDKGGPHILILFGNGAGGFDATRTELDTTAVVQDIAVGDFDDDDDLDIAVITNSPDSLLQVFQNDDGRSFTPQTTIAPCTGDCPPSGDREDPVFMVAGDFDGDGDDDLSIQVTCFDGCDTQYDAIRFLAAEGINGWSEVRTRA